MPAAVKPALLQPVHDRLRSQHARPAAMLASAGLWVLCGKAATAASVVVLAGCTFLSALQYKYLISAVQDVHTTVTVSTADSPARHREILKDEAAFSRMQGA